MAGDLAEVTGLGAEDFLNNGRVAQPCKDGGDAAASLPKDGNLKELLVPYPANQIRMWEISPRVNSAGV